MEVIVEEGVERFELEGALGDWQFSNLRGVVGGGVLRRSKSLLSLKACLASECRVGAELGRWDPGHRGTLLPWHPEGKRNRWP